ncbi:uncharacterized protein LOC127708185 [Mytilus californianus]|uniref:uncharacterized protein LOC127708185 n=1 Tax=Mytilus californianus TaxID=6549 RepID=UPI00224719AE|nr:uncharacterized protein LOC127708185 [Mytilus californianus]
MDATPSDKEFWNYMKLLTFTLGIGMEVLHHYFEQKILNTMKFFVFIDRYKHNLFHECYPRVPCCQCSENSLGLSSKKGCLDKLQFQSLFNIACPTEHDHYQLGHNNEITKECLCRIDAKRSNDVDCMDITLMYAILKSCFINNNMSIHGHPKYFETIKETRNFLAHTANQRISESEFNSRLTETEQAILGIASTVGTYFAKVNKKKIDLFKIEELSMDKIKDIIESNADDVKKNLCVLIEEQKNTTALVKHVKDEIIQHFTKHKDELSTEIGNLRFEVKQYTSAMSTTSQKPTIHTQGEPHQLEAACSSNSSDVQMTENDKKISKCRVEWRLETPDEWNLAEIKENLENCSHLLRRYFEIEFVYVGSLVIKTLVPRHILNDRDQMQRSVHLFLEKVLEVCKINTDESAIIKVALIVSEESCYQEKESEMQYSEVQQKRKSSDKVEECKNCQQKDKIFYGMKKKIYEVRKELESIVYEKEYEMQYFKKSKKSRYVDQIIKCDSCEQKYETISGMKEKISNVGKELESVVNEQVDMDLLGKKAQVAIVQKTIDLQQCPTNKQLAHLSRMLSIDSCKELVIQLEVSKDTLKSIWDEYKYHLDDYKFMMLWKWKENTNCSSFQDLLGAMKDIGEDDQKIYQVFTKEEFPKGIAKLPLNSIPKPLFLEELGTCIGIKSFQLAIELDFDIAEIHRIRLESGRNLRDETREILKRWVLRKDVSLRSLVEALNKIQRGMDCVYKHYGD